jgi:hypothetical protein
MTNAAKPSAALAGSEQGSIAAGQRAAGRTAQILLGIPLGLFQLAAVIGFTITDSTIAGADWLVVVWGIVMSTACAVLAVRVYRSARARRIAFAVLAAQALFSAVKLGIYHESASFVFFAIIAVTVVMLGAYHRASRDTGRARSSAA